MTDENIQSFKERTSAKTDEMLQNKDVTKEFDYSKLAEETGAILECIEQDCAEIIKMKVECAIANIELASTMDAIDFESKIKNVEQMIETFVKSQDDAIENTEIVTIT